MKKILVLLVLCTLLLTACGSDENVLTMEKFEQIENGMTYEEVVEIIGIEGTLTAELGEKGTDLYTVSYMYSEKQTKGSLGANASFMFQGGKLNTKVQLGLK